MAILRRVVDIAKAGGRKYSVTSSGGDSRSSQRINYLFLLPTPTISCDQHEILTPLQLRCITQATLCHRTEIGRDHTATSMDESPSSASMALPPDATYGFIGLGNMGFGMAKNVREKIPGSSKLVICELVTSQRDKFVQEVTGDIEPVETPQEVGERCVCVFCERQCRSDYTALQLHLLIRNF